MKSFDVNPIVNIVRAEIVTNESTPRVMFFDTISSAVPEPFISEGEEKELRVRNTIMAQNCLDDIIKGYNIKLKDCVLSRELMCVVDGGSCGDAGISEFAKYSSPVAGIESNRVRFTLRLYASEKDYGGNSVSFFRFSFPNCYGTPAKFSLEEGNFATPEYTVRSRPGAGECAMTVECLDKLPIYCGTDSALPPTPAEGDCIIATEALTIGSVALGIGEMAYYDGEAYIKIGAVSGE